MGYWSAHPMGGDYPLDAVWGLEDMLFPEDKGKASLYEKFERLGEKETGNLRHDIARRFNQLVQDYQKREMDSDFEDSSFVIPFTVLKYKIPITDKETSAVLKGWIGDGGAEDRGYNIPEEGDETYPSQENHWNGLQTPFDYAVKLYDLWDHIMEGKLPFDIMEMDEGLFAAILKGEQNK